MHSLSLQNLLIDSFYGGRPSKANQHDYLYIAGKSNLINFPVNGNVYSSFTKGTSAVPDPVSTNSTTSESNAALTATPSDSDKVIDVTDKHILMNKLITDNDHSEIDKILENAAVGKNRKMLDMQEDLVKSSFFDFNSSTYSDERSKSRSNVGHFNSSFIKLVDDYITNHTESLSDDHGSSSNFTSFTNDLLAFATPEATSKALDSARNTIHMAVTNGAWDLVRDVFKNKDFWPGPDMNQDVATLESQSRQTDEMLTGTFKKLIGMKQLGINPEILKQQNNS